MGDKEGKGKEGKIGGGSKETKRKGKPRPGPTQTANTRTSGRVYSLKDQRPAAPRAMLKIKWAKVMSNA